MINDGQISAIIDVPLGLMECLVALGFGSGGVIFASIVLKEFRGSFLVLLASFIVTVAVAVAHRVFGLLFIGYDDAVLFEGLAATIAFGVGFVGETDLDYDLTSGRWISWVVAGFYEFSGRAPLVFQLFNVTLAFMTKCFIVLCAVRIWGSEKAFFAALISALVPAFVIYAALPLRESLFWFFIAMGIFYTVVFIQDRLSPKAAVIGILSLTSATFLHGSAVFLLIVAFSFKIYTISKPKMGAWALLLIVVTVVLGIFALAVTELEIPSIGGVGSLLYKIENIVAYSMRLARGDAAYPDYIMPTDFISAVFLSPLRVLYFLVGPLPWDIGKLVHIVGVLDGLLYGMMLGIILKDFKCFPKSGDIVFLSICIVVFAVVLSWGTSNFGTGLRHRAKVAILLIPLISGLPTVSRFVNLLTRNIQNRYG